ncbi:MAG: hypothetical protein DRQ01_06440 [Ignavibacteriae bacterium]|nr:MAG: hypothetical protein DRQ01_06440 [Ignavibacteriota bacterium]
MKKLLHIIFTFTILIVVTSTLSAQPNFVEQFDYTAGDSLRSHGWTPHSGSGSFIFIVSGSLTYPGYPSAGNSIDITMGSGSREDVNKDLTTIITTGAAYVSFLVQVDSASIGGTYFLHLNDTTGFNYRARVFARDDSAGNLRFGISKGSSSAVNWTTSPLNYGQTYLLVLKYEIITDVTGSDDLVKLYINPDVTLPEPGSPDLVNTDTATDTQIGFIFIRQGSVSPGESFLTLDEIRVGTSWFDVVPVELVSFNASVNENSVTLSWITATELNNSGFEIERTLLGSEFEKVGFVPGHGTSAETHSYSFVDQSLAAGSYAYRLKQIDLDGTYEYSNIVNVEIITPIEFELSQNYPNPFNPSTTIKFSIPEGSQVSLKIYNSLGQEIKILVNQFMEAGVHNVNFNAVGLNSGMYFYRLNAGEFTQVRKMTLIK